MPLSSPKKYMNLKQSSAMEGKKLYMIIYKFMDKERDQQKDIEQFETLFNKGKEMPRDKN